jgi:hypothetical protein
MIENKNYYLEKYPEETINKIILKLSSLINVSLSQNVECIQKLVSKEKTLKMFHDSLKLVTEKIFNIMNVNNIKLKENVKANSPSPDQKVVTTNSTTGVGNKIPISMVHSNKIVPGKGLNIIPIKNIQSHREGATTNNYFTNNERIPDNRFSPKPRDIKITTSNLSPNQGTRGKLIPIANKPLVTSGNQVGFETNKLSNRILTNIINNINNKSPSPKHSDATTKTNVTAANTKKSPR